MSRFRWQSAGDIAALVRDGTRAMLVIVPGAMSDASGWLIFAETLRTPFRIAIVNRRGRSPSASMPADLDVCDEVRDLDQLLDQFAGPFVLFGWSYGGLLCLEAARNRTDVMAIVLYDPIARPFATDVVAPLRSAVDVGDLDRAVTMVFTDVSHSAPAELAAVRASSAWQRLKLLVGAAATELAAIDSFAPDFPAYARIEAPLTIITGEANAGKLPYGVAADRFRTALPAAQHLSLTGTGHLAQIDSPRRLAEMVDDILADIATETHS